jgi:hypothetical protein
MPAQPVTAAPVNILDNESLYNVVVLGGVTSPGKVVLSGHDRVAKWDTQLGPFMVGARTIFKGSPPVQFKAVFSLLRDLSQGIDDFATWPAFRRLIESTLQPATQATPISQQQQPGVLIKALPIYHPALSANGITAVTMARIGGEIYDGKGGMVVEVELQQYKAPRLFGGAAVVKPKVDPNQDLEDTIKALKDRALATPWG